MWGRRPEAGPEVRQLKKSKQSLTLFCLTIFSVASINLPLLVGVELQPFQSICTGQLICTEFPSQVSKPHDSMQRTSFYWQISTSPSGVEKWHFGLPKSCIGTGCSSSADSCASMELTCPFPSLSRNTRGAKEGLFQKPSNRRLEH